MGGILIEWVHSVRFLLTNLPLLLEMIRLWRAYLLICFSIAFVDDAHNEIGCTKIIILLLVKKVIMYYYIKCL